MVNEIDNSTSLNGLNHNDQVKRICCIGAGYVGGPTSAVRFSFLNFFAFVI